MVLVEGDGTRQLSLNQKFLPHDLKQRYGAMVVF